MKSTVQQLPRYDSHLLQNNSLKRRVEWCMYWFFRYNYFQQVIAKLQTVPVNTWFNKIWALPSSMCRNNMLVNWIFNIQANLSCIKSPVRWREISFSQHYILDFKTKLRTKDVEAEVQYNLSNQILCSDVTKFLAFINQRIWLRYVSEDRDSATFLFPASHWSSSIS